MKHTGQVTKEGKFLPTFPHLFKMDFMRFAGQQVTVEVSSASKRSIAQNNKYWVLITQITEQLKELGNSCQPQDVHALMKSKFLTKKTKSVNIDDVLEEVEYTPSTTQLTKSEFSDYYQKIEAWAAEFLNISG